MKLERMDINLSRSFVIKCIYNENRELVCSSQRNTMTKVAERKKYKIWRIFDRNVVYQKNHHRDQ